jgi:hypothetical protein
MAYLRAQNPPLATTTCIGRFFALRTIFHELARTSHLAELADLLLREDIPRSPHTLPRPLTGQQDQLLQQEFMLRNDLGGNVFLLLRYTGMRIGECSDLSYDCLRSPGPNQWAIHVPLGKLKTERMVPVRYVDVALTDLEREFQLARSKPRHLAPQPKSSTAPARAGLDGLIDSLIAAQHVMEMFRRSLPDGNARKRLLRLSIRLIKILAEIRKLQTT